jgi:uncharacterized protein YjbI with pentapeptide repeats
MANPEHLELLRQGVDIWNGWRAAQLEHLEDGQPAYVYPDLSSVDLSGANLGGANLSVADLSEANLRDARLIRADLSSAVLRRANLCGAKLLASNLRGATLPQANLSGAELSGVDLVGADLVGANLRGAHLMEADLNIAQLIEANLGGANLDGANLDGANLSGADLSGANLGGANLSGANLSSANLSSAQLVETNLIDATLTDCRIYGISAWNVKLNERTNQQGLIITPFGEPKVTVDDLEVAQFVYLLLHNEKIRRVIDTVGKKGVLLLGRFTEGRIAVLERLRDELRKRGYLPIVFNFDKPETKDFTETVRLLAGLSKFVIADITNPKSAPLELQATVPEIMVPFRPIIEEGEKPFAMLRDLWIKHRDWVFEPIYYSSVDALIASLDEKIIRPAEARFVELQKRKAETMGGEHV